MTKIFQLVSRAAVLGSASVLVMLAGCGQGRDPFFSFPPLNDELSSHIQKQPYALVLQQREVYRVAVECTYNTEFRSSKGVKLTFDTKSKHITHFQREDCDTGGKIVLVAKDGQFEIHTTHAYTSEVLDKQMSKVIALTNEMRSDAALTKHMMSQEYTKVFKDRRIGAIDLVCDDSVSSSYHWERQFEFPYQTPYSFGGAACEFGAAIKIRPTLEGYTVSSNTAVAVEDFDNQMHAVDETTKQRSSM